MNNKVLEKQIYKQTVTTSDKIKRALKYFAGAVILALVSYKGYKYVKDNQKDLNITKDLVQKYKTSNDELVENIQRIEETLSKNHQSEVTELNKKLTNFKTALDSMNEKETQQSAKLLKQTQKIDELNKEVGEQATLLKQQYEAGEQQLQKVQVQLNTTLYDLKQALEEKEQLLKLTQKQNILPGEELNKQQQVNKQQLQKLELTISQNNQLQTTLAVKQKELFDLQSQTKRDEKTLEAQRSSITSLTKGLQLKTDQVKQLKLQKDQLQQDLKKQEKLQNDVDKLKESHSKILDEMFKEYQDKEYKKTLKNLQLQREVKQQINLTQEVTSQLNVAKQDISSRDEYLKEEKRKNQVLQRDYDLIEKTLIEKEKEFIQKQQQFQQKYDSLSTELTSLQLTYNTIDKNKTFDLAQMQDYKQKYEIQVKQILDLWDKAEETEKKFTKQYQDQTKQLTKAKDNFRKLKNKEQSYIDELVEKQFQKKGLHTQLQKDEIAIIQKKAQELENLHRLDEKNKKLQLDFLNYNLKYAREIFQKKLTEIDQQQKFRKQINPYPGEIQTLNKLQNDITNAEQQLENYDFFIKNELQIQALNDRFKKEMNQ